MANFSTPDKVDSVIQTMENAAIEPAANRALLNEFFNGCPLWTEEEAKANKILINFNDKQGAVFLHTARAQYENGLLKRGIYFKVTLPDAPPDKQKDWSAFITREINKPIMNSSAFYHTQDSVFGGVCLHGVGAKMWWDEFKWRPSFMGVQDILMPTDTELTMDNCQYFAVRRRMRPGELFKKTFASQEKNRRPEWNYPVIRKILDEYKELNQNPQNTDWSNNPERMVELYKQNRNYYDGDSAPVIWMWDFFHREEESSRPGWYRKIILDKGSVPASLTADSKEPNPFIYNSKYPFSQDLSNIIHFQFGDGNNVPPFMYKSIRSLAFLTYELLWTLNRLRCQWTQHVFEQMLTLFRIQDPNDRSRLEKIVMDSPWGIIPEGLNMVPAGERYTVDANLVGGLRDEYKALVGQATSAYTQNYDQGNPKERTKYEVQALLQQTSALMGSLLSRAYQQEHHAAREIARRFTLKKTTDFDCKKFQASCKAEGISDKWIDVDRWEIEIEQKLGGGNRMLELAEAGQMMEHINLFDPSAQQEIKHDYALAITNNPKKASRLAPTKPSGISDAVHDAELAFGTLMQGIPVSVKEGLNHIEQVETILKLMQGQVGQIMKTGGVGTPQQLIGLHMAAIYVGQHIQIIAQDPNEKQRVKQYGDVLGKLMNQVKAFEQRQQEMAAQSGNGNGDMPPEVKGKIAAEVIKAQAKAKIQTESAAQRRQHRDLDFAATQRRQDAQTVAEINRQNAKALAEHRDNAIKGFQE